MSPALLEQLVQAVLYEGHILYPYRPSSKKNQRERFTFGRVYPESYSVAQKGLEPCLMQTECLVKLLRPAASLDIAVRFFQPSLREIAALPEPALEMSHSLAEMKLVPELRVDDELYQTWHEAIERDIRWGGPLEVSREPLRLPFSFPAARASEPIHNQRHEIAGVILRRHPGLDGTLEVATVPLEPGLFKVTVRIVNQTPVADFELSDGQAVLLRTFASAHAILHVTGAEFISLLAPRQEHQQAAEACKNIGAWPVLVGDEETQERDTMLSSPIILYDYPKLAPESAGQLFDATEIDEILTLRILTMTEQEKVEMRRVDEQARKLLERTEALPEHMRLGMHGRMRRGGRLEETQ